jgi:hypothetical protein
LLVRLDTANFDFAQAGHNGNDILFTRFDGTPIPFEIERWDSLGGLAEIWFLIDTIFAGSNRVYAVMHWGNPDAQDRSSPPAVFDTTLGFSGVWHLGEESAGIGAADIYKDATSHGFHGTDFITSSDRNGIIGYGHGFDTTSHDYIDLGPNRTFVQAASAYTLEAWVNMNDVDSESIIINHSIDSDTPPDISRAYLIILEGKVYMGGRSDESEKLPDAIGGPVVPGVWHHVAGVIDFANDSCSVYIDGIPVTTVYNDYAQPRTPDRPSFRSAIGAQDLGDNFFFNGSMDEVRSQRGVRSAAWIKMCCENQKPGSMVVKLE